MLQIPVAPAPRSSTRYEPLDSPAVSSIVAYRFGSSEEANRPDRVLRPPGAAIMLLRRGLVYGHDRSGRCWPMPPVALLGPRACGHVWGTAPETEFVLINLAPGAAWRLFGADPGNLVDQLVTFADHPLSLLLRQHVDASAPQLDALLRRSMATISARDQLAARQAAGVVQTFHHGGYGTTVQHYAARMGLSMRSLQRLLREQVGLSPKQILAVERIRQLVVLTADGWRRSIAELAQAGGYFDQSHLRYELLAHDFGHAEELLGGDHIVGQRP